MSDFSYFHATGGMAVATQIAGIVGGIRLSGTTSPISIVNTSSTSGDDNRLRLARMGTTDNSWTEITLTDGTDDLGIVPQDGLTLTQYGFLPDGGSDPYSQIGFFTEFDDVDEVASALQFRGSASDRIALIHRLGEATTTTAVLLHEVLGTQFGRGGDYDPNEGEHNIGTDEPFDLRGVWIATGNTNEWVVRWYMRSPFLNGGGPDWVTITQTEPFVWTDPVYCRSLVRHFSTIDPSAHLDISVLKVGIGTSIDGDDYGASADDTYGMIGAPRDVDDEFLMSASIAELPDGSLVAASLRAVTETTSTPGTRGQIDVWKKAVDSAYWRRVTESGNAIVPNGSPDVGIWNGVIIGDGTNNLILGYTKMDHTDGNSRPIYIRTSSDGGETWAAEYSLASLAPGTDFVLARPGGRINGTWLLLPHEWTSPNPAMSALTSTVDVPASAADWALVATSVIGAEAVWQPTDSGVEIVTRDQDNQRYLRRALGTIDPSANGGKGGLTITSDELLDGLDGRQLIPNGADPIGFARAGDVYYLAVTDACRSRQEYWLLRRVGADGRWQPYCKLFASRSRASYPTLLVVGEDLFVSFALGRRACITRLYPGLGVADANTALLASIKSDTINVPDRFDTLDTNLLATKTDVAGVQTTADATLTAAQAGGGGGPIEQEPVPRSLLVDLVPRSGKMIADNTIELTVGDTALLCGASFSSDLRVNVRVEEILLLEIATGTSGGVTSVIAGTDHSQAKFTLTPVTAGEYVLRLRVRYSNSGGTRTVLLPVTVSPAS